MRPSSSMQITELLRLWHSGDKSADEKLWPLVFGELKRMALYQMTRERPDHTLQAGALVNEVYLRLVDWRNVTWQNRAHFFGTCARMMRRILVDHARSRHRRK